MKKTILIPAVLCGLLFSLAPAFSLGTAFNYQGRLAVNSAPANGTYDFRFNLYAASSGGSPVATALTIPAVAVANGLFTTSLDFGSVFNGTAYWLDIAARTNGSTTFVALTPRQELRPTPYAIFAANASNLGGQPSTAFAPVSGSSAYVAKAGDTMTGSLDVNGRVTGDGASSGNGVYGVALGISSTGVWGVTDSGAGVRGESDGGFGVYGTSKGGSGVVGQTAIAGPTHAGVFGANSAPGGTAVIGNGLANNSAGVAGVADTAGSTGVYGRGNSLGVFGTSTGGKGVYGTCATAGPTHAGVFGENSADGGTAVVGNALAANSAGVAGVADTAGSTGVYGRGNLWAGYFDGNVSVCTLTIRGGCDLAEPFRISTREIQEGSVVVIDDTTTGQLKMSERSYDTRVAGIVSGANGIKPGIALHQEGAFEGGQNVALSGRVYVLADASSNPIKPGDLLTTSDTPGHAMKVSNPIKAQGAILGKAMSPLKEGQGMVLVLVTLQ